MACITSCPTPSARTPVQALPASHRPTHARKDASRKVCDAPKNIRAFIDWCGKGVVPDHSSARTYLRALHNTEPPRDAIVTLRDATYIHLRCCEAHGTDVNHAISLIPPAIAWA